MNELNKENLEQACEKYPTIEGRARFYDVAVKIVDAHPLQASIILLAVWNMNRFRFMASDGRNLVNLQKALEECKPLFERVKGKDFRNVDFDEIEDAVKQIYSTLSKVKGVEYTGASKVMHLLNRDLFLMWDSDMREEYCYKNKRDENGYFDYLKQVQNKVRNIEWNMSNKTLPKAIDEFNFVNITYPRKETRKKDAKMKGKKIFRMC